MTTLISALATALGGGVGRPSPSASIEVVRHRVRSYGTRSVPYGSHLRDVGASVPFTFLIRHMSRDPSTTNRHSSGSQPDSDSSSNHSLGGHGSGSHSSSHGSGAHGSRFGQSETSREDAKPSNLIALAILAVTIPIALLPWFFGGTAIQAQFNLVFGLVFALVIWLVIQGSKKVSAPPVPTALIPLVLVIVFGAVQILPLPSAIMHWISPNSDALWRSVSSDSNGRAFGLEVGSPIGPARPSMSVYPAATRHQLAEFCLPLAVFFLAMCFFHDARGLSVGAGLLLVNGAVIAFLGISQRLRHTGSIYEVTANHLGELVFGSFMNKDNAAGYLTLCLAIGLGILIQRVLRKDEDVAKINRFLPESRSALDRFSAQGKTVAVRFGHRLASLHAITVVVFTSLIVVAIGIMTSASYPGLIAFLMATVVTSILYMSRRETPQRKLYATLLILGALGPAIWFAHNSIVAPRSSTKGAQEFRSAYGLLEHWREGLVTAGQFWGTGSGLGTYRYAYLLNHSNVNQPTFQHAENQYLEALVEAGVPGLLVILSLIVLMAAACIRLLRETTSSLQFATGVAGIFVLVAQVVHAFFDFGLYLPANAALFALICGSVVGQVVRLPKPHGSSQPTKSRFALYRLVRLNLDLGRSTSTALASCLVVLLVWAAVELRSSANVQSAITTISPWDRSSHADLADIDWDIANLSTALRNRPDDAEGQLTLAELWLSRYQLQAMQELLAESNESQTESKLEELSDSELSEEKSSSDASADKSPSSDKAVDEKTAKKELSTDETTKESPDQSTTDESVPDAPVEQMNRARDDAWERADPRHLNRLASQLQQESRLNEWEEVRSSPVVRANLPAAARSLLQAAMSNVASDRPYRMLTDVSSAISKTPCVETWLINARIRGTTISPPSGESATSERSVLATVVKDESAATQKIAE